MVRPQDMMTNNETMLVRPKGTNLVMLKMMMKMKMKMMMMMMRTSIVGQAKRHQPGCDDDDEAKQCWPGQKAPAWL